MTRLRDLDEINKAALRQREDEESSAPEALKKARLRDLLQKPRYIGFVEGNFLADLTFVMFLCDRDDGMALRLLWKREYEPTSMAIWRRLVMESDLVVDVGGHTGIYSIVAGLSNPEARVHTFEPHEMNFGRLLLNLRANGLTAKTCYNVAASSSAGAVPFKVKINHYLSSGGSVVAEDQEFAKMVPCVALDEHVPLKARKACIKIDVEGHEIDVLAGMPKLLELKPDLILECAFVPAMLESESKLKAGGYRFFRIDELAWELQAVDTLAAPPEGVAANERENVLVTTKSEEDVRTLLGRARADYNARPSSSAEQ